MVSTKVSTDEVKVEGIKSQLFALSAACDRGFGASSTDRDKANALIEKLQQFSPIETPTKNLFPSNTSISEFVPLEGAWKLVYTSAFDVISLAASPLTLLQGIYQVISRDGRSANIIDLAPRFQAALPQFLVGSGSTLRLKVGTFSYAKSATRVGLSFRKIEVKPMTFLGNPVDFFPKFSTFLPQAAVFGDGQGPGYFDVLYLDHNCLIIKQNSPGGVFVNIRSEKPIESFL